jgi:hypothetical protein
MITIQQDALHAALNAVTRASLKSSLAAFSLVRLDVKTDGILRLSCFNGETAARAITNVVCDEDISVSVDALTLKAVVETLANEIRLMIEHNSLIIQSSTNRTTLRIVDESIPVPASCSCRACGEPSSRSGWTLLRSDEGGPTELQPGEALLLLIRALECLVDQVEDAVWHNFRAAA